MHGTLIKRFCLFTSPALVALGALVLGVALPASAETPASLLKTTTGYYTNVTLFNRTATHLSFAHAGGVAVLKLKDVDADSLTALTRPAPPTNANDLKPTNGSAAATVSAPIEDSYAPVAEPVLVRSLAAGLPPAVELQQLVVGPNAWILYAALGVMLVFWLFFCYCCAQICKKAGHEPGFLVWLPVLQLFPLIKAARMSAWWFVLWFVPLVNLVAQVFWCIKIAEARGKSPWVGIFLILPVTNLFAFLYLAFSGTETASDDADGAMIGTVKPFAAVG